MSMSHSRCNIENVYMQSELSMNIRTVAQMSGVSIATVSRVFNRPTSVNTKTREAVMAAANKLGYSPNWSAQALRGARTQAVGVVLPTLANPAFAACLQGIGIAASCAGYAVVPFFTNYEEARELQALQTLRNRGVDGVVLTVANAARSELLRELREHQLPFVLMYNRHTRLPWVSVDQIGAVRSVVQYLSQCGHKRIVMVVGSRSASDRVVARYRGYCLAMEGLGLKPEAPVELSFMQPDDRPIHSVLSGSNRPDAIVCSTDLIALRVMRVAAQLSIAVPDSLSIVGFDGIDLAQHLPVRLASIGQPHERIGEEALRVLLATDAPLKHRQVELPFSYLAGDTVRSAVPVPAQLLPDSRSTKSASILPLRRAM
jgi:DNA-binding LacI/PurR family transcriptional regulator